MKNDKIKLHQYIFLSQMIMIASLAIILGTLGIYINLRDESLQRDRNLQNVAEAIAHSAPVATANSGSDSTILREYLDSLKETLSDIDVISVVGQHNIRLYHSNHELIGTVFDGTLPDFQNSGRYYTLNDSGPSGAQRRAYAAIYSSDGSISGFVMTIMLMSNINSKNIRTLIVFIAAILVAILIEFFISLSISRKIKKTLLGYEPDTFSAMYKIRDNILETLNEGIIAVNERGITQYMNESAREMLSKDTDLPDNTGEKLLGHTLLTGEKEYSVPVNVVAGADIIMDRIPVMENGSMAGAFGILHNRTEYTRLAEDLAGTRFLVDSMRANNHDFTNKLHVILGLLQMEMYDEAMKYIENITIVQRETISEIMHKVAAPSVAALLIGKNSRASELNVKFIFRKDSIYNPDDFSVPEDVLVTVIGNLIDNALDSMNESLSPVSSEHEKELWFGIYSSSNALLITVDDTGSGISNENLDHIFEKGFSTKGSGRGTGLYHIKELIDACGGTISVQSQEGSGTSFTVSFTKGEFTNV